MLLICFTGTEGKTEIDDDRNEKKKGRRDRELRETKKDKGEI